MRASDTDCTAPPAGGRTNWGSAAATVGLIVATGETVAGMVNAATGGLGLGLEVGVGMGTSVGVGSGMMATPGVMVGKIVGVGFCPQAKGSKKTQEHQKEKFTHFLASF